MATLKPLEILIFGRKAITTAGTAEILLGSTVKTENLTIRALDTNTGKIYVGDNTVDSTSGFPLAADEAVSIDINHRDTNIYIDSDNDGEGVAFIGGRLRP